GGSSLEDGLEDSPESWNSPPESGGFAQRQAQRVAAQPVQSDLRRQQLHPVARAPELIAARGTRRAADQRDAHRAYRAVGAAAVGPGDARGRDREVGARALEGPGRHLEHALLAHRAVLLERLLAHAELGHLELVGVGHEVADEKTRAAWHVGQAMADKAAGAGF